MTTHRIHKKWRGRDWLLAVDGVIDAVERFTGKEALNIRAVGKTADEFLHGEAHHFITIPLKVEGIPDSNLHFVFERWPLKVTLRTNKGILDSPALKAEYESRCGSHPDIQVLFREIGYEEMKRELVASTLKSSPVGPEP